MGMEYLNWKAGKKGEKSAIAQDESLAEHDKKYHPEGFDPKKDECKLRETMAAEGKKDDLGGGENGEEKEAKGGGEGDEIESANGKVLKVGSLVVPMSFADKENKRHLSRVVLKVTPKSESGFGPYVYLKGAPAPYKPNDLYAFDGRAADSAEFKVGDKVEMKDGSVRGEVTDVSKANGGLVRVSWENGNATWEKGSDVKDSGKKKTDDGGKGGEFNAENLNKKIEALRDSKDWRWGDIFCEAYDFTDGTKGVGIEIRPYGNQKADDYWESLMKALGDAVGGKLEDAGYEDGVIDHSGHDVLPWTEAFYFTVRPLKKGDNE